MDAVRSKLQEAGQTHVLDAFPDLQEQHLVAQQVASMDIKTLIKNYRTAAASEQQGANTTTCGMCAEKILPVNSVRLDDQAINGYICKIQYAYIVSLFFHN